MTKILKLIPVCPKCLSPNIDLEIFPFPYGAVKSDYWECSDCGAKFPSTERKFVMLKGEVEP